MAHGKPGKHRIEVEDHRRAGMVHWVGEWDSDWPSKDPGWSKESRIGVEDCVLTPMDAELAGQDSTEDCQMHAAESNARQRPGAGQDQ